MLLQIITIYCFCDTVLQQIGHREDPQAQMTDAEVMTVSLVASRFFASNFEAARLYLEQSGDIPTMLSRSRLNRRLRRISPPIWKALLKALTPKEEQTFLVDSCPVAVCAWVRAGRCRLYPNENGAYFGYCKAKELPYYGLKAHVVTTSSGKPIEIDLLPACSHDLVGLVELALPLPEGSSLLADKGYTDYQLEERLMSEKQIQLLALRKSNSKRPHSTELTQWIRRVRKRIETTFSLIASRLPRRIAAVTAAGFELKVRLAFVAYAILG